MMFPSDQFDSRLFCLIERTGPTSAFLVAYVDDRQLSYPTVLINNVDLQAFSAQRLLLAQGDTDARSFFLVRALGDSLLSSQVCSALPLR